MGSYEKQQNDVYGQFMEGQIKAFYKDAYAPLIVYAERLLGAELSYLAEDCVQDAVFEAYGKRGEMLSPSHLKQFVYRCVHNNAISFLRRDRSKNHYLSADNQIVEEDYSLELVRQETFERLAFALAQLPADLQDMARMVFSEGLSGQDIAKRIGLSLSGVKKRKARLLRELRSMINDERLMAVVSMMLGGGFRTL